ncbi:hypothetical protein COM98_01500 [Bacillus cereus]|nr:hypothetical protein COM98_01500 [Bacillus cereus]
MSLLTVKKHQLYYIQLIFFIIHVCFVLSCRTSICIICVAILFCICIFVLPASLLPQSCGKLSYLFYIPFQIEKSLLFHKDSSRLLLQKNNRLSTLFSKNVHSVIMNINNKNRGIHHGKLGNTKIKRSRHGKVASF